MSKGPLAERYLDEALGFAIGFSSIRLGDAMVETEEGDGVAHGVRAVAGAVGGVNILEDDDVTDDKGKDGVEECAGTGGGFIGERLCEGHPSDIVDGDVQIFPSGAADVIVLWVASDAIAGTHDACEFLDVEAEKIAWVDALVAHNCKMR